MNNNQVKKLFIRVEEKNILIRHVCEVGVYLPETSNVINFIKNGIKTTLVEPDLKNVEAINKYFGNYNITIHPVAIYDYNGKLELVQYEASTFAANLKSSPALENEKEKLKNIKTFEVECKKFDEIDDGTIDLLSVDTEGCEWYVLKYMKSQPLVISIETHGKSYLNPFINEINTWMKNNEYVIWYKDSTDTVFVKNGKIEISKKEKLQLEITSLIINLKRLKYRFKKKLFS
ncbi:MAG: FkbM family methyltransferase [Ignavibacteria bacterium]|nr:FkbM family methyltransferase [Ignavibacteria bacterium]